MPLAAALYGVLLGLGFTTFVLSFGVWALAGIGFALGDPHLGLVIGAAFGIGRAIPVVLVAPVVDSPVGVRCVELMASGPPCTGSSAWATPPRWASSPWR